MDFSVVVPVRNRPTLIRKCVEGICGVDYPAKRFEVIVVDNGSTDHTAQAAREAGARVVIEPVANRSAARNRGAQESRAPWIVFIDSDCIPHPQWLQALKDARDGEFADQRVALLAGAVRDVAARTPVESYVAYRRWFDQTKYLAANGRFWRPFALTANLAVRRDVYLELGGLDRHRCRTTDQDLRPAGWGG